MAKVEVLPLGGAGEIGRNCTVLIQGDDMIVVDVGISFPNEEMPGVEIVIPDFSFLIENKEKLRGVFLTHAHEDHVGALPFLLRELPKVPVYATEFTHAMVHRKLEERLDVKRLILKVMQPGDIVKVGSLEVEFVHVTHSIPDTSAFAVHTEHGVVLFTADFKFDFTPVDGRLTALDRLTELGKEGVVLLLSDSTNVERPGWGPSERAAMDGLRKAMLEAPGRVLMTTFASNIHRMQQAMDAAFETGRKVAVAGRRMEQTLDVCTKLNYIKPPKGVRIRLEDTQNYEPHEIVIFTTGSQGEPMSALTQMSKGEYNRMHIQAGDTLLYSARPIPGNEAAIWRTINRLYRLGATVIHDSSPPIHVSGHGYREELKMMINLTKPFYLAPVHGEPRHQHTYLEMARAMGYPEHRIFELHDGMKLTLDDTQAWTEECVSAEPILIDASMEHIVSSEVLREKNQLAEFGVITIGVLIREGKLVDEPSIEAHGYTGSEMLLKRVARVVEERVLSLGKAEMKDLALVQSHVADAGRVFFQREAKLRPVVIPVILQ